MLRMEVQHKCELQENRDNQSFKLEIMLDWSSSIVAND